MKATLTIHRADRNWLDIVVGCVWWYELRALNEGVPWVWKGFARTEKAAERKARRHLASAHRAEVYRLDTRTIELYANGATE